MGTIYVWLLIVQAMPGANSATVYVIDNITTQAECERVQKVLADNNHVTYQTSRCVQVAKVKGAHP